MPRPTATAFLTRSLLAVTLALSSAALVPAAINEPVSSDAVAEIDGQPVFEDELMIRGALRRLEQEAYEARVQAAERVIDNRLIRTEASRRGVTAQELFQSEVVDRVAQPGAAEVEAFYESQGERIGRPLDEAREDITSHLHAQGIQAARSAFVARLRSGADVRILLKAPRLPVDVAGAPTRGPAGAPVTVVEFSDFECPYCKRIQPMLERLHARFGDSVRWVAKDLPLERIHPHARPAAEASRCAGDQEKLWEYRAALFATEKLEDSSFAALAADLDLDAELSRVASRRAHTARR